MAEHKPRARAVARTPDELDEQVRREREAWEWSIWTPASWSTPSRMRAPAATEFGNDSLTWSADSHS